MQFTSSPVHRPHLSLKSKSLIFLLCPLLLRSLLLRMLSIHFSSLLSPHHFTLASRSAAQASTCVSTSPSRLFSRLRFFISPLLATIVTQLRLAFIFLSRSVFLPLDPPCCPHYASSTTDSSMSERLWPLSYRCSDSTPRLNVIAINWIF